MISTDTALQTVLLARVQACADSIAPGYCGFRGLAPEPACPIRVFVRWAGPGSARRALQALASALPAGCTSALTPGPALLVAADRATLLDATRRALVAGGGLPPDDWAALWATYHAVRGRIAPPTERADWHEWTEPQEEETAA